MSWHPCLLILGQNCNAKCQLLNILLGEKLLPTTKISSEENCKRRRIRFTHGTQTRLSLALPEQYELVHMMAAHRGQWDTIPEEDLEIGGDSEDPAHRIAELEVMLPYSLLKVTGCLHHCGNEFVKVSQNYVPNKARGVSSQAQECSYLAKTESLVSF